MRTPNDEFENWKIKQASIPDILSNKIKTRILDGTWKVGDKLPTEHELAEIFGVSRLTVRAALQKLSALGVLESRVGNGTYVKPFDLVHLIDEISDYYSSPELTKDVSAFRQATEVACIDLAIKHALPEEVVHFLDISEHLMVSFKERKKSGNAFPSDKINEQYQLIFAFHEQIYKMAHNDLLYYSYAIARTSICRTIIVQGEKRWKSWNETSNCEEIFLISTITQSFVEKNSQICKVALTKFINTEIYSNAEMENTTTKELLIKARLGSAGFASTI